MWTKSVFILQDPRRARVGCFPWGGLISFTSRWSLVSQTVLWNPGPQEGKAVDIMLGQRVLCSTKFEKCFFKFKQVPFLQTFSETLVQDAENCPSLTYDGALFIIQQIHGSNRMGNPAQKLQAHCEPVCITLVVSL